MVETNDLKKMYAELTPWDRVEFCEWIKTREEFEIDPDLDLDDIEIPLKSIHAKSKQEWSEDKYPKNIETDAVMFCFDNGLDVTPYQAKMIAKYYYELGFKRIGDGKA